MRLLKLLRVKFKSRSLELEMELQITMLLHKGCEGKNMKYVSEGHPMKLGAATSFLGCGRMLTLVIPMETEKRRRRSGTL
jgi:hypothetical protein